jgi:hypothetical protein
VLLAIPAAFRVGLQLKGVLPGASVITARIAHLLPASGIVLLPLRP